MSTVIDHKFLNALISVFGGERTRRLLQLAGSAKKAWLAPVSFLTRAAVPAEKARELVRKRAEFDPEEEWQKLKKAGVDLIGLNETRYPPQLREIHSPPLALYSRGDVELLQKPGLAVVGTRAPTSYGRSAVGAIIPGLVRAGLVVTSGLAQGIDALAHYATLRAGGRAIAVLGSGVDELTPKITESLGKEILKQNGLIVSEYPLGTPPLRQHFPARNRIIAGLSLGVVVIESGGKGGSLITARDALESGREVFAVPGPIGRPASEGTNRLIQQGAKLVSAVQDILEELALPASRRASEGGLEGLDGEEKSIMELLAAEPLHIDTIIKKTKLNSSSIGALLTALEIKGAVRNNGGNFYERII